MTHLLTNIPSGTGLYMQPEGSPRLGPIRFNAHQFTELPFEFPSFSVEAPGLPSRNKIDIRHLVGYYRKYVGPIDNAYFNEVKAQEILFIADHKFHKDRSMKELHEDYERKRKFEDNYGCDDCYPWACRCPEDCDETADIPWASDPDTIPETSILKDLIKDVVAGALTRATERVGKLDRLICEAKANAIVHPQEDEHDAKYQEMEKTMVEIRALLKDIVADNPTGAALRIGNLDRIVCEAKANAMVRIQASGHNMSTQLEAHDKKYQEIEKVMSETRALIRALDWAERFPRE